MASLPQARVLGRVLAPALLALYLLSPGSAAAKAGGAPTSPTPTTLTRAAAPSKAASESAPTLSPGGKVVINHFFETNPHYAGSNVTVSQRGKTQLITITPTNEPGDIIKPVLVFRNPSGKWSLTGDNTPPLAQPPKPEPVSSRPLNWTRQQQAKAAAQAEADGLLESWSKIIAGRGPERANVAGFAAAKQRVSNILEELPQTNDAGKQQQLLRQLSMLGNPSFNDATASPEGLKKWGGNCESATMAIMLSAGRKQQYDTFVYTPEVDHLDGGGATNTMRILRANGASARLLGKTQTSLEGIEAQLAGAKFESGQMLALQSMSPTEGHVTVLVMLSDKKWYVVNNQSWYTANHDLGVVPGKLQMLHEWVDAFQRFGNDHAPPKTAPGTDVKIKWNLIATDLRIPFANES